MQKALPQGPYHQVSVVFTPFIHKALRAEPLQKKTFYVAAGI